ncbi:MAG: response regulator [Verrucomicrobia bacterium]|nr:response regulator [Verrucomicrobiota bacterium]
MMIRKKILLVDDDRVILKALSIKLKAKNYDVVTAVDGSEAVKAVRKEKPDLILLDISFPPDVGAGGGVPWDGFRIVEWLMRLNGEVATPIIVITGGDPAKYEERARAIGATAFFHKPINHDSLLTMIKTILEKAPATSDQIESQDDAPAAPPQTNKSADPSKSSIS